MARAEQSAGVVVVAGEGTSQEYLLLDYGRHWDFAKGHLEAGEDELTAAMRELKEETGLSDVRLIQGFRQKIEYFFRDKKGRLIKKGVTFFLAETANRDIVLSHEHVAFAFLPYEQALKKLTYANAREVLKNAHLHLSGAPAAADDRVS